MKIYICSPYDGIEENYFKAINYCRYVIEKGHTPICPVTMLHGVLEHIKPDERETYHQLKRELCKCSDEVWVFGKVQSGEKQIASSFGKKVRYIQDIFRLINSSETLSVILREYETMTGRMVNRGISDSVLFYLNAGQTDKLIIAAIKKAAKNNAGWSYVEGILKNCLSKGITTLEEFESRGQPKQKSEESMVAYDLDLYEKMINSKD